MKNSIYETMTTPYATLMDKEAPWNIYPRPQLVRDSFLSLNGKWDFKICDSADIPGEYTEKILVPFPPESLLSGQKGTVITESRRVPRS